MSEHRIRKLASELVEVISDSIADLKQMPFFVRPMVKRGFVKRTGRSLDQWTTAAADLERRARADGSTRAGVLGSDTALPADLAKLAENYRTTPERARGAGMRAAPATFEVIRRASERREQTVRELIAALDELP